MLFLFFFGFAGKGSRILFFMQGKNDNKACESQKYCTKCQFMEKSCIFAVLKPIRLKQWIRILSNFQS